MFNRCLTRTTLAAFAAVCCALGALVLSSTVSVAATPTPTPFANAAATRDNLLTIAKAAPFNADNLIGFGVYPAWSAAYPGVGIDGYGVLANGSNISSYDGSLYPKDSSNPIAIAFALKDAAGACAAGAISGSSSLTSYEALALPAGAACSGQSALEALRLKLPLATVTPAATATTTATIPATANATTPAATARATAVTPLPPTTGTGPSPDSTPVLPLLAAGIVLLLSGSAVFVLRRRE